MTRFADALLRHAPDDALVSDGRLTLSRRAAAAAALAPSLGARPRLALSLRSTPTLLRVLAAADGVADALLLLSADIDPETARTLALAADCPTLVSDRGGLADALDPEAILAPAGTRTEGPATAAPTRWIMTTSGTTGLPKMAPHSLASLSRTVRPRRPDADAPVWGLLYEATRFAGMQVLLQASLGGGLLAAPPLDDDFGARIAALTAAGCTHLSATPTLWRRLLMHPAAAELRLTQATLGGEIADQPVLEAVQARFPHARVTHVFASTEAGVGFSVQDGRTGFPARYLSEPPAGVEIKVAEGRLWLRPPDGARRYVGGGQLNVDAQGFVDTGDEVAIDGDRVLFRGRHSSVVNVGGTKVNPEVVEALINSAPGVAAVRVVARANPFTGSVLVAQVTPVAPPQDADAFRAGIIRLCRERLPPPAVPALVQICAALEVNAAGKLGRKG